MAHKEKTIVEYATNLTVNDADAIFLASKHRDELDDCQSDDQYGWLYILNDGTCIAIERFTLKLVVVDDEMDP